MSRILSKIEKAEKLLESNDMLDIAAGVGWAIIALVESQDDTLKHRFAKDQADRKKAQQDELKAKLEFIKQMGDSHGQIIL